ncbi:insulinase family protein [Streptomyces sp. NPDC021056]|uniref:M16 family metallopeptidase n=1 Tax=Streptomyces sp. NPDC021056 TaxID=3155012 RepID=UPI0033EBB3B2
MTVPALAGEWAFPTPPHSDVNLANGLRVVAVRAPSVPLTEIRLRLPLDPARTDPATAQVLAATLLPGPLRDTGSFAAEADGRGITVTGTVLETTSALDALVTAVTAPRYTEEACRAAARGLAARAGLLRADPTALAMERLRAHCHGDGYRTVLPDGRAFAAVTAHAVARLHASALGPARALLLVVGSVDPERAVREVATAWATWPPAPVSAAAPAARVTGTGVRFVDRPGAQRSQILLTAPVPGPSDPRFPAVALACCVLGGSFSSRLATALREDTGLAYQVRAILTEHAGDRVVLLQADTAADRTEAAVRALGAELLRLREEPPTYEEVDGARAFLIGTVLRTAASQAGLADHLVGALETGSVRDALQGLTAALARTGRDEVVAAAHAYLAPERFTGVVVG